MKPKKLPAAQQSISRKIKSPDHTYNEGYRVNFSDTVEYWVVLRISYATNIKRKNSI